MSSNFIFIFVFHPKRYTSYHTGMFRLHPFCLWYSLYVIAALHANIATFFLCPNSVQTRRQIIKPLENSGIFSPLHLISVFSHRFAHCFVIAVSIISRCNCGTVFLATNLCDNFIEVTANHTENVMIAYITTIELKGNCGRK